MKVTGPIGVFDSGYGGLTVLQSIREKLGQYDYLYFGDNARAPYGNRSFEEVYTFTKEAVQYLFDQGCPLVILACNTASAKALRSIQQNDLKEMAPDNRVLGVIRPSAEVIGMYSQTGVIGLLATQGTVQSNSYQLELQKFFPNVDLIQKACPGWVTLIERGEIHSEVGMETIQRDVMSLVELDPMIDTILLGCTHYPIIQSEIQKIVGDQIRVVSQGEIVAESLAEYLVRHPQMEERLSQNGQLHVHTSGDATEFAHQAQQILGIELNVQSI